MLLREVTHRREIGLGHARELAVFPCQHAGIAECGAGLDLLAGQETQLRRVHGLRRRWGVDGPSARAPGGAVIVKCHRYTSCYTGRPASKIFCMDTMQIPGNSRAARRTHRRPTTELVRVPFPLRIGGSYTHLFKTRGTPVDHDNDAGHIARIRCDRIRPGNTTDESTVSRRKCARTSAGARIRVRAIHCFTPEGSVLPASRGRSLSGWISRIGRSLRGLTPSRASALLISADCLELSISNRASRGSSGHSIDVRPWRELSAVPAWISVSTTYWTSVSLITRASPPAALRDWLTSDSGERIHGTHVPSSGDGSPGYSSDTRAPSIKTGRSPIEWKSSTSRLRCASSSRQSEGPAARSGCLRICPRTGTNIDRTRRMSDALLVRRGLVVLNVASGYHSARRITHRNGGPVEVRPSEPKKLDSRFGDRLGSPLGHSCVTYLAQLRDDARATKAVDD
nr:MAG TPA: hypothetical protein [Caudoviricetes sp.]